MKIVHAGQEVQTDGKKVCLAIGFFDGVHLGQVKRVQGSKVVLHLEGPLKPGDGVVFDAGHPDEQEEGGRVYSVSGRGDEAVQMSGRLQLVDPKWKERWLRARQKRMTEGN